MTTTMKEVAKAAGVSLITVSRVINSPELVKTETRLKVQKVMKELQFLPNHAAKALAENSTRAIHLYVPRHMEIADPFTMQLIAGVSEKLSEAYYLFLIRRDLDFNQRCDGVIVIGLNLEEEKVIKDKLNVPFVLFGKTNLDVDCIDIDNVKGAMMMTEHLIHNGHSKIGFIMINTDLRFAHERLEGYKQALRNHNIKFDEKLVKYGGFLEQDGYNGGTELLTTFKPTAIFCCNDMLAIGAFRAAQNLRLKVPEDISIAGFDSLGYDLIPEKPLTTVRQPVFNTGKMLVETLLQRIKNPDLPFEKTLVTPEIIIRNSVAPLYE